MTDRTVRTAVAPDVTIEADVQGCGPPVLLVHGWPHTRRLWDEIAGPLARTRTVIAPDQRGVGGSTRADWGYDAGTLAGDLERVLDEVGAASADVVAIDAGVPPAFLLALRSPARVRRLVLMEATLGRLPGAEEFFAGGPPWWFGFHQAPGLAESVLAGNEGAYLDFFYRAGTADGAGIDPQLRDAFVASYSGTESLRAGLGTYRAMAETARQLESAVATSRLRTPTLAVGAKPVGDALHRQLAPIADELSGVLIDDCGHLVPVDRSQELLALLETFLADDVDPRAAR